MADPAFTATGAGAAPNIDLGAIYDRRYVSDDIQYGTLRALAELLGRAPLPHRHDDFIQIHLIEWGEFELQLDGAFETARGPAVFLTPPATPHAFTLSPEAHGHVLTVRQALLWRYSGTDDTLPSPLAIRPFCAELTGPDGIRLRRELTLYFNLLQREFEQDRPGSKAAREALAGLILATTLRIDHSGAAPRGEPPGDLRIYRRYLQLIDLNVTRHLPIVFYARELNVTEDKLHQVCRACAGRPPKVILRDRVLHEARRQLVFSAASVKQVAAWLGFKDVAYFCRLFKLVTGVTPSEYRAAARDGAGGESAPVAEPV
jgi:AraC family 4-hydroxyphenylacetate 3-monooxygenase operon regulatory protein